jgi:REP element-mobilizing transposase RayT
MSNHIHFVISSKEGFELAGTLRDLKTYLSKQIVTAIKQNERESRREWMLDKFHWHGRKHKQGHQFWQMGNHSIPLYDHKMIDEKMEYIHLNPVRTGLVDKPEDWLYSSARNYITGNGILEIDEV